MVSEYLAHATIAVLVLGVLLQLYFTNLESEFKRGYDIGKLITVDSIKLSNMRYSAGLTAEHVSIATGLDLRLIHDIETAGHMDIKQKDYAHVVQTLYAYYNTHSFKKCYGSCKGNGSCSKSKYGLHTIQEPDTTWQ